LPQHSADFLPQQVSSAVLPSFLQLLRFYAGRNYRFDDSVAMLRREICMGTMDLREAKACLGEYRNSLSALCDILNSNVTEDGHRELKDSVAATLGTHTNEALALYAKILKEMIARRDHMVDCLGEWADLMVELNALKDAIDRAEQARANHLQVTATSDTKKEETFSLNPTALAILRFKHRHGGLNAQEREEYNRNEALRKAIDAEEEEDRTPTPTQLAIEKYLYEHGSMSDQEREKYERKLGPKKAT
jgi:hypothetical protein